jgi:acetylornithine deacetylase/succinyl-diaminopimelate desuccinylase-like protein
MGDAAARVLARIDDLHAETVELTQAVVRIDSTNPNIPGVDPESVIGGETRVNEVLEPYYRRAGLEVTWVAPDDRRRNLVGVRRGTGGGRSLALNGHVDTVAPVDAANWVNGSPWNPEIRDGRLYGLGSTDMKSSGAAMWTVAQAFEDCGVALAGDLHLHSVIGEEMMEAAIGTSAVIEAGFQTDAAIVTEPTSFPAPLSVNIVAPGVLILRITVTGIATHAGNRPLAIRPGGPGSAIGVNALERLLPVIAALGRLEDQWGMSKHHPYFPPGYFTIGPNTLHADAGVPFPAYFPDRAAVEYVVWYQPRETPEQVRAEIEAQVTAVAQLDPWLREHPPLCEWLMNWLPYETEWEHPLVQTMARAHGTVTGAAVAPPSPEGPLNFGAACDASFYQLAGIPAIAYGPGDLKIAHCRDEHVLVAEITTAAKALALAVIDWSGED